MVQHLAILGSTGSIGKQTLDVCRKFPELFKVEVLTANKNADELCKQAIEFQPDTVVIADESLYEKVQSSLSQTDIKVYCGSKSVADVASFGTVDTVVLALVGFSGLKPAVEAIKAGKKLALANKEVLVVAGEYITNLSKKYRAPILPIDSEHSAIFQCLNGEKYSEVEKIILTASGGPFRGFDSEHLKNVTLEQAAAHPVWNMGSKITIDSATMMNKGFELIEARWLFGVPQNKIDILIHPQSIIHSMVQFVDGSIKALMSKPDMRLPILYALSFPARLNADFQSSGLENIHTLTFEKPDYKTFKHLQFAVDAINASDASTCVLNAANEVCVNAFLDKKMAFYDMQFVVEDSLTTFAGNSATSVQEYEQIDAEVRSFCKHIIK